MRVVLVSRFPKEIDKPKGGVETATVGLARALSAEGVEDLHVLTLEREVHKVVEEEHEGIKIHRLPRSRVPMMFDVFFGPGARDIKRYLKKLNPDLVHFHETWGFGAPGCGFPSVFTVHGFDSLNLPTEQAWGWKLRSMLWRLAESLGMRGQSHIISIAPYVKRSIEPLTKARIYDIWNSLDSAYFNLQAQPEPGRILFLGWLNPRKNPLVLVKAVGMLQADFPDIRLVLCGAESDKDYAEQLKAQISEQGLEDSVELAGSLSQTAVKEQLVKADMLVLPSLQENAPMVIAEAMAAGVPVIASDLCGIPDMVTGGVSGTLLKDPHDAAEVAKAIAELMSDRNKRKSLVDKARKEAYSKFHPSEVAKATIEVYEELTGSVNS